jgi:hypothetical protein
LNWRATICGVASEMLLGSLRRRAARSRELERNLAADEEPPDVGNSCQQQCAILARAGRRVNDCPALTGQKLRNILCELAIGRLREGGAVVLGSCPLVFPDAGEALAQRVRRYDGYLPFSGQGGGGGRLARARRSADDKQEWTSCAPTQPRSKRPQVLGIPRLLLVLGGGDQRDLGAHERPMRRVEGAQLLLATVAPGPRSLTMR